MVNIGFYGVPAQFTQVTDPAIVDMICNVEPWSRIQWIWSQLPSPQGNPTYADQLHAAGKTIIVRTMPWGYNGVPYWPTGECWTYLYQNPDGCDRAAATMISQIDLFGSPYGCTISEEEPGLGYNWGDHNWEEFRWGWNELYTRIKAARPNVVIHGNYNMNRLSDDNLRDLYWDAFLLDVYSPTWQNNVAEAVRAMAIQAERGVGPEKLYFLQYGATTPCAWGMPNGDPQILIDTFMGLMNAGVQNIGFYMSSDGGTGWGKTLFGEYAPTGYACDKNNPYLHKQTMLGLIEQYGGPPGPPVEYILTIGVTGQGNTYPEPGQWIYDEGDVARVTALPADGSRFIGWTGDITSPDATIYIPMDSNKSVMANFEEVAVGGTVVGILQLDPGVENIGVMSDFSGDDPGQNHAVLHYRRKGVLNSWKPSIPMTVDRRDELVEFGLPGEGATGPIPIPNAYKNQWRAVIFGLQPNTEYDVRVTYTDSGGVSGSPVIATVRTRNDNPPSVGATYYVSPSGSDSNPGTLSSPFRTIQHAADLVNPGDIVNIMPGTYTPSTSAAGRPGVGIMRSGTPDNYITFQSHDMNNMAVIDGQGSLWHAFHIRNASYIRIRGIEMRNFNGDPGGGVTIGGKSSDGDSISHGVIVEDCVIADPGTHWADSCILVRYAKDAIIQRNYLAGTDVGASHPTYGVFFLESQGGMVVNDNMMVTNGDFRDCIGGVSNFRVSGGIGPNSFVYRNYCEGPTDDGIEIEGGNLNIAIYENVIKNNELGGGASMNMGLGLASTIVGPLYAIRNVIIQHNDCAVKLGSSSYGSIYLYHNTVYSTAGAGPAHFGNDRIAENIIGRNNIYKLGSGRLYESWEDGQHLFWNDYDYDFLWTDRNVSGFSWVMYGVRYGELGEFQAATGWELHAVAVPDPMFVNAEGDDFRLLAESPCRNAGVILPGFNDANSPWPYTGSAPDLGAYEGVGVPPPTRTLTIGVSGQGSTDPEPGIYSYPEGTAVWVEALPDAGSRFVRWEGAVSSTDNPMGLVISGNMILTAVFEEIPPEYILTIGVVGQGNTDPEPGQWIYDEGDLAIVTAAPLDGWRFIGWTGDITSPNATIDIVMTNNASIIANFEEIIVPPDEAVVIITIIGEGTTIPSAGEHVVTIGTSMTIQANPAADSKFDHWEGHLSGSENPTTIDVDQNMSIIVVFIEEVPPAPGVSWMWPAGIAATMMGIAVVTRRRRET